MNLLLFTVYDRLGSGELKPIKMILQLADCSTRLPKGRVEDVLIKLGAFIFPVDFVVLEIEGTLGAENEILVILVRPFLPTTNALIKCRDRKLTLTFGNTTIELNGFNLQKQPVGFDDIDHQSLNWVSDLAFGEVGVDREEELMSCVYESF